MQISEREKQIVRIRTASFQPDLSAAVELKRRQAVVGVTKATLESAWVEELAAERARQSGVLARRSGYFSRVLETEHGRIESLRAPKLRSGNKARQWQILQRYHRGLGSWVNFRLSLYVMGRSLRDLQAALYDLRGSVLSVSALNRVTIAAQTQRDSHRQSKLTKTPPILMVDGVWVDIQYPSAETKVDRAGHVRQIRQAQERVVLTALAVCPAAPTKFRLRTESNKPKSPWLESKQQPFSAGVSFPRLDELTHSAETSRRLGKHMQQMHPDKSLQ